MSKLSRAKPGNPASYKYNYNFRSTGRSQPKFCTKLHLGKLHYNNLGSISALLRASSWSANLGNVAKLQCGRG